MAESRDQMVKLQSKEDRISALPDVLIQHILSLLPSTKEAIHTTILSKRFHNQWTRVSNLIFHSNGMSAKQFSRFIDCTLLLHDYFSKIKKLHINADYDDNYEETNNWNVKLRCAIRKDVEELFLTSSSRYGWVRLPKFLFEHASFVKLHTNSCNFVSMANGRASLPNLKTLNIEDCMLPNEAIENILSGSPSLESLELSTEIYSSNHYYIVSNSLKKLLINEVWSSHFEISCPNLEELKLFGCSTARTTVKLMELSSSICATLDFEYKTSDGGVINNTVEIKNVKELKLGSRFIRSLSFCKLGADLSSLLSSNKFLILDSPNFEEHSSGIERTLRLSYVLEKLIVKLPIYEFKKTSNIGDLNIISEENYWYSKKTVFNCLVSHLKIVEIDGISERDNKCKLVLSFIQFLLKNARVLEKLIVILKDGGKDFLFKVSQTLLDFPRCSQQASVKLLCSD